MDTGATCHLYMLSLANVNSGLNNEMEEWGIKSLIKYTMPNCTESAG